jgi:hypothetical protein
MLSSTALPPVLGAVFIVTGSSGVRIQCASAGSTKCPHPVAASIRLRLSTNVSALNAYR